jgi:hypothetical protein
MNPEKKYLIKYFGDASKRNLYWFKDKEEWTGDLFQATRFNKPEGITEVGRLLVEQEWVTRLIPMEEIKVKPVSLPSEDFILVVDCDGDPQEVFSGNTSLDQVFQLIDKLDRESGYYPHSAWRWGANGFSRVFEVIGKDPK